MTFWSEEPSFEWKARKTTIFMNLFTCYIGVFYDEITCNIPICTWVGVLFFINIIENLGMEA